MDERDRWVHEFWDKYAEVDYAAMIIHDFYDM